MRRGSKWMWGLVVGLAAAGCATTSGNVPQIQPDWVARVPPDRMGPIEQARLDQRRAEHEAQRAKLLVDDAKRSRSVEDSELTAARARVKAAEKSLDAANAQGNSQGINDAQEQLRRAQYDLQAANNRIEGQRQRIEYRQSQQELAEAKAVRAAAETKRAEYQVLYDLGDARVRNIAPADFDRGINQLARREEKLQREVDEERVKLDRLEGEKR